MIRVMEALARVNLGPRALPVVVQHDRLGFA